MMLGMMLGMMFDRCENNRLAAPYWLLAKVYVLLVIMAMPAAYAAEPHDPHAHHRKAASENRMAMADIDLPDGLILQNQYGDSVKLREDAIGEKIVVVGFAYTTCTTVCPVVSAIFAMVQKRLKEQLGKDVALITITVDPTRDTPHRLLDYSRKYNASTDWTWLTGDKKNVDKALSAFGAYTPNFEDHPAMLLIGDESSSKWYRYYGFPAPQDIERKVNELLNSRNS